MPKAYWKLTSPSVISLSLCEWVEAECNTDPFVVKLSSKESRLRNVCCSPFSGITSSAIEMSDMSLGLMLPPRFIFRVLLLTSSLSIVNLLKSMFLEEFEWIKALEERLVGMSFGFLWVWRFSSSFIKDLSARLYLRLLLGINAQSFEEGFLDIRRLFRRLSNFACGMGVSIVEERRNFKTYLFKYMCIVFSSLSTRLDTGE